MRPRRFCSAYKRDGSAVATPVSIAFDGDRAFFRTWHKAWKTKRRLAKNPAVEVAPCTLQGQPTGPTLSGRASLLDGRDAQVAAQALARRHPVLQRLLVPTHRLMRYRTMHYEAALATVVKADGRLTRLPDSAGPAGRQKVADSLPGAPTAGGVAFGAARDTASAMSQENMEIVRGFTSG